VICPKCFAHIADTSLSCPTCGAEFDLNGNIVRQPESPAAAHPHAHHHVPPPSIAPALALASGRKGGRIVGIVVTVLILAGAAYGVVRWRETKKPVVAAWPSPPRAAPGLPSGGLAHTCVITEAGTILCWGDREFGQLGDTVGAPTGIPCAVCTHGTFTQLAGGENHTCARTTQGAVMCWGGNYRGQLGSPSTTECVTGRGRFDCSVVPIFAPVENAAMVTAGAEHSCALLADSTVACWGGSYRGQLGVTSMARGQTIALVAGRFRFTTIAAGAWHTCGIAPDGRILCWGWNAHGQLGSMTRQLCGPTVQSRTPCGAQPALLASDLRFRAVAAGAEHSCALTAEGGAYCWGANDMGQLGRGTLDSGLVPVAVAGGQRYTALAAGARFTCALDGDGGVWCWGSNSRGQLGTGSDSTTSLRPVRVPLAVRALSIGAGAEHACAVVEGKRAFCWGAGASGQLGNGRTTDSRVPVEAGLDVGAR
jgi:alpha-tubulin suppressor-like RCC1 family protein